MQYKNVESLEMPSEIDKTSSPDGIYVRRNIKKVETENGFKYCYQEAFLSFNEYESYSKELLVNHINGEDNTKEYEKYKKNLDTGVLYSNGKYYKPKWAAIYSEKINEIIPILNAYQQVGGDVTLFLNMVTTVYDVTKTIENAEQMNIKQIIELWFFLLQKQEEFYNEYKKSLSQ